MGAKHLTAVVQGLYGLFLQPDALQWKKSEIEQLKTEILRLNGVSVNDDWTATLPQGRWVKLPTEKFGQYASTTLTQAVDQYLAVHLSGEHWFAKLNAEGAMGSTSLNDLDSSFKNYAKSFVGFLKDNSTTKPNIGQTYRPPKRGLTMHWSFMVGKEHKEAPVGEEVFNTYVREGRFNFTPKVALPIIWDHGVEAETWAEAMKLKEKFKLQYPPAPNSRHFYGKAIDMNIPEIHRIVTIRPVHDGVTIAGFDLFQTLQEITQDFPRTHTIAVPEITPIRTSTHQLDGFSTPVVAGSFLVEASYFVTKFVDASWNAAAIYNPSQQTLQFAIPGEIAGIRQVPYNQRLIQIARHFFKIKKLPYNSRNSADEQDYPHWESLTL